MGLLFSLTAFAGGYLGGRRSVGAGMAVVLVAGYFYGILRARYLDGFSHFIFDGAVFGLYVGHFGTVGWEVPPRGGERLFGWAKALLLWPVVVFGMALCYPQHPLIQLVGLRAAVWFLPFLLIGARAGVGDLTLMARVLAVLNPIALAFALGEYYLGLERFLPRNAVTELMYLSKDVAGFSAHRIPATFSSAAAYGGVMAASLPWLVGRGLTSGSGLLEKLLIGVAILSAAVGAFLCGSRTPVLFLFVLGLVTAYELRFRLGYLLPVLVLAGFVAYVVSGEERMQRFTSLQDAEMVTQRVGSSANVGVLEVLSRYPLGAGLGSAWGTSIPSFLQHLATEEGIGAENELARIGVEQGFVGLGLWLLFLTWVLTRRHPLSGSGWRTGGRLMFVLVCLTWVTAWIGAGTLLAIPGTSLLLFAMGRLGTPYPTARPTRARRDLPGPLLGTVAVPAAVGRSLP